jgi:hypothetical protein
MTRLLFAGSAALLSLGGCAATPSGDEAEGTKSPRAELSSTSSPAASVSGGAPSLAKGSASPTTAAPVRRILDHYTDITGTDLAILFNYESKTATAPQDDNLQVALPWLEALGIISIPASTQQTLLSLLQTPLSQQFNTFWATAPQGGKSAHDLAVAQIVSSVQSGASQLGSKYTAYNIEVGHVVVKFQVTSPHTGGSIPDPKYHLEFDANLLLDMSVPTTPCALAPAASLYVQNANISAANWTATLGDALESLVNIFNDDPASIFQGAEGEIDGYYIGGSAPIVSTLASMGGACTGAVSSGFTQFGAFIDASTHTLGFRLTHPVDPAPGVSVVATSGVPSVNPASIGASAVQVTPGSQDTITGANFPVNQATAIAIEWSDTVSGDITQSNLLWGPVGGARTTTTLARSSYDNGNHFTASGLLPDTTYQFQVQDCDALTCTPYSAPLTVSTAASSTSAAALVLTYGGAGVQVGSATVSPTGTFSTTIAVPGNISPGTYPLSAQIAGQTLASVELTVVATARPLLAFYNPSTNTSTLGNNNCEGSPCQYIIWGNPFTLRGTGYAPGVVTITINASHGLLTYSATADATGQFTTTITANSFGYENDVITASEVVDGTTIQATVLGGFSQPPS